MILIFKDKLFGAKIGFFSSCQIRVKLLGKKNKTSCITGLVLFILKSYVNKKAYKAPSS
jgi:hypothetical protein